MHICHVYCVVPRLSGLQELPCWKMALGQLQRKFPPFEEVICNLPKHSPFLQRFPRVLRTVGRRAQLFHQAVRVWEIRLVERMGARVGKQDPRDHPAQQRGTSGGWLSSGGSQQPPILPVSTNLQSRCPMLLSFIRMSSYLAHPAPHDPLLAEARHENQCSHIVNRLTGSNGALAYIVVQMWSGGQLMNVVSTFSGHDGSPAPLLPVSMKVLVFSKKDWQEQACWKIL